MLMKTLRKVVFWAGDIFRQLKLSHDDLYKKRINCFISRQLSLLFCLLSESVGPNVLFHQLTKRVAHEDMTKMHTLLS